MNHPALQLHIADHPLLELRAFVTILPSPIGELPAPAHWSQLLKLNAPTPFSYDDNVKSAVRNLLRKNGFKPTGRSKPASEYLRKAAERGTLGPINLAVDACNVVSLHSGLPISVVDLQKAASPYRIDVAAAGSSYVFNPSGQVIDIGNLLCLFDAEGPCANAVKDSQRTKTDSETTETLSLIWGTQDLPGRVDQALAWYRELLAKFDTQVVT